MKPPQWRLPQRVAERHAEMVRLRGRGLPLKDVGRRVGVDHSTVIHHLSGACRCAVTDSKAVKHYSPNGKFRPVTYWLCDCGRRVPYGETLTVVERIKNGGAVSRETYCGQCHPPS